MAQGVDYAKMQCACVRFMGEWGEQSGGIEGRMTCLISAWG